MELRALPPEKAKRKTKANFQKWKRRMEIVAKRKARGFKARFSGEEDPEPEMTGRYSKKEEKKILSWRKALIAEGKGDPGIARSLSRELKRPVWSVYQKIRRMVEKGEAEENLNNAFISLERSILIDRNPWRR